MKFESFNLSLHLRIQSILIYKYFKNTSDKTACSLKIMMK